jgi:hypothetical protein
VCGESRVEVGQLLCPRPKLVFEHQRAIGRAEGVARPAAKDQEIPAQDLRDGIDPMYSIAGGHEPAELQDVIDRAP